MLYKYVRVYMKYWHYTFYKSHVHRRFQGSQGTMATPNV